jgi:hypothetical protein
VPGPARPGPDGKKARKPRHGTGKRWKVHYTDPDSRQRSESFDRKVDAESFKTNVEADLLRGAYIDPDAGTITLRKYAEEIWFPAQTFGPSTRELVETRMRLHILPMLGSYRLAELSRRPSTVQASIRGLQNGKMEASGIKLVKGTLSSILGAAIAGERIAKNPCKDRSVKVPKPVQRKIIPWTAARVAASGRNCPRAMRRWPTPEPG